MKNKVIFIVLVFVVLGCTEQRQPLVECDRDMYATVVEIKDAKVYEGVDGDYGLYDRQGLGWWHAEIDIIFSVPPIDMEVVNMSTTHFMRGYKQTVGWGRSETDFTKYHFREWDHRYPAIVDWEQTKEVLTLQIAFHGIDLFSPYWGVSSLSYDKVQEAYPDIDWGDFTAYTLDFTLDWNAGRKTFKDVPIKPTQDILERFSIPDDFLDQPPVGE